MDPTHLERLRVLDLLGAEIGRAVSELYTRVATAPGQGFHFPTGRAAARQAGYPEADLDAAAPAVVERFAGVGCPLQHVHIAPGDAVLDVGCGAGLDLFVAARRTGPEGRVVGIELTEPMAAAAEEALRAYGLHHAQVVRSRVPRMDVEGPFDVVTSNGSINLVPEKEATLGRLHRLLGPGGALTFADIVLARPPAAACLADANLWAECLVGAYTEDAYLAALADAGFEDVQVHARRDYFAKSTSKKTRDTAKDLGAAAWVVTAKRPGP